MTSPTTDAPGRSAHRLPARVSLRTGLALLAALAAFSCPAAATDRGLADREPVRFYIESVAVEGARRASPEVIVSESLLEEGIAYTEADLRDAIHRINRLPFVLEAGFSLGKGSERGRYSLLITVEEVRGFFFGSDLTWDAYGGAVADVRPEDEGLNEALTAGLRLFAGQGVFFAAVADGEGLQVGYERYRLAGRPVFLRLAVAREGCCAATLPELGLDPGAAVWTAEEPSDRLELTVGVPLGGNHSLRFDASRHESGSASRRPLEGGGALDARDVEGREIELAWVFDSTDDPVFPTRGDVATAAVGVRWLEGDLFEPAAGGPAAGRPLAGMSSRLVGLSFAGARHWPLSARQAVSLSLGLLLSRSEVTDLPAGGGAAASADIDALEADFAARYSLSLWGRGKTRRLGELRWETVVALLYADASPVLGWADPLWGVSLRSGIALRNTWGIFRLGVTFLDYDGEL